MKSSGLLTADSTWIFLALLSGFFVAVKNILTRKLVFDTERRVVLYAKYLFPAILSLLVISVTGLPEIKAGFYFYIISASLVDMFAAGFLIRSIASAQLAQTFPLIAFTPIFLLGTAFFILGEVPTLLGLMGIFLVVSGAYLLKVESLTVGIFEPFKLLLKERGPRFMLIAAFMFSFLAVFFKKAVLYSSPVFALCISQLLCTMMLSIFFLHNKKLSAVCSELKTNFHFLALSGIASFIAALSLFAAFELGLASYVISIKRTSILFTIILGYIFFKEDNIIKSLLTGSLMIIGIFLISIG